ncbi:MAG: putative CRISPR-associated protein [Endomicrobium sp.]|jgi:putative CRISPR-associated protein (TIGR02619 family)|nr:putative CRISPR-associated protein [Endomicrobium sp.]
MKTIVITCGTSVLTNLEDHIYQKFVYANANKSENDLSKEDKELFNKVFSSAETYLEQTDNIEILKKASAELNTILSYYNACLKNASKDMFYLLTTDTYSGIESGKILSTFLNKKYNITVSAIVVKNLKADTKENFEEGIKSLYENELFAIFNDKSRETVFILSGGFKSWSGYMQSLGMFYGAKILYQFETAGEDFIEIPKIPFKLNEVQKQSLRLLAFEKKPSDEQLKSLPKTAYFVYENECELAGNGKILWNDLLEKGFYNILQESLSDKLKFSDNFKKDYEKLNLYEKKVLGEKIDNLAMYFDTGEERYNLKSLKFHSLTNVNGYQREIYPFNDSRRVYIKEQNGMFLIDKIAAHLK